MSLIQACRAFDNAGQCVSHCPLQFIYSATEYNKVPNPAVKYAYGTLCVDQCPCEYAALASLSADCPVRIHTRKAELSQGNRAMPL